MQTPFDNNVDVRGFLKSQKSLIKSGVVVFYSSYKLMGLKVNYLLYLKIFLIIANKE